MKCSIMNELISCDFPSICLSLSEPFKSPTLISGFYRQWSCNGKLTELKQIKQIKVFVNQIEQAARITDKIIITGDANLCANKWNLPDFLHKSIHMLKGNKSIHT